MTTAQGQTGGAPNPPGKPQVRALGASVLVDAGVIAALTLLASCGFAAAYGSAWFLLAVAGGLLVGIGCAVLGAWLGLTRFNTLLVAIAAYFLLGTAFALPRSGLGGVLPTLTTLAVPPSLPSPAAPPPAAKRSLTPCARFRPKSPSSPRSALWPHRPAT